MLLKIKRRVYILLLKVKFSSLNIFNLKKIYINFKVSLNEKTTFEGHNHIKSRTNVKDSYIGLGTYVGENCNLNNVKVGRFCSIANNVRTIISDHPLNMVSTHPCFHRGMHPLMRKLGISFNKKFDYQDSKVFASGENVIIGSDVWIGESVKIMAGVNIGDGAVIGAGTIVTKDIPPYAICVGVPARIIKYRFNEQIRERLIQSSWWDMSITEMKENENLFLNVESFLERVKD